MAMAVRNEGMELKKTDEMLKYIAKTDFFSLAIILKCGRKRR
jgi:hypothetical protein